MHSNAAAPPTAHEAAEVQKHVRTYLMVGGALLVATGITVAVSYVDLGGGGNIALALIIAVIKASLVAAIFMHLNHEKTWIYGSLVLTAVFFATLMLLPILTTADTPGRHRPAAEIHDAPAAGEPVAH
jgi:cytochrome c oxidase subunit 4